MYEDLVKQFNDKYTEEEKNLLFLYKSRIGVAIDCLNEEEDKVYEIYEYYKKALKKSKNAVMNFTVFRDISLTDFSSFKRSLQNITMEIEPLLSRLELKSDMTVYRMVSINKKQNSFFLSRQSIVPTSIDIDEFLNSCFDDDANEYYLYQINLAKGSRVAVCPYTSDANSKDEQFGSTLEKELILDKGRYDFNFNDEREIVLSNSTKVKVISLDAQEMAIVNEMTK